MFTKHGNHNIQMVLDGYIIYIWVCLHFGLSLGIFCLLISQMLKPAVRYFKELAAEQNGDIRSIKHRS